MRQHLDKKLISWASILEEKTADQARATSTMPFIFPHVALMPDAHLGKGATVGSVIPTERAIIPAAVGVDIGCGMDAVLTQWTKGDLDYAVEQYGQPLSALREAIEQNVPLSAGKYNGSLTESAQARIEGMNGLEDLADRRGFIPDSYAANWRLQLGSLGSGNHFIEVSLDELDRVWLFLHSGSRGVGNKIAQHHIKVARAQMQKWHIALSDPDLAYLPEGTSEFWAYIGEMRWAQEFARQNRAEMMDRVAACLSAFMDEDVVRHREISCHHNYTEQERHFGRDVWLSRKGAIDATEGTWGLIPGSMGTRSYIVQGKGNGLALNSAPHGAGREFSRSAARRTFLMPDLVESMRGIEWRKTEAFLDEIPAAYKDIDVVMSDAAELVEIKHTLRQIVNVKGD